MSLTRTLQIAFIIYYLVCSVGFFKTGNREAASLSIQVALLMVLLMAKEDAAPEPAQRPTKPQE